MSDFGGSFGSLGGGGLGMLLAPFLGPLAPIAPFIGSAIGGSLGAHHDQQNSIPHVYPVGTKQNPGYFNAHGAPGQPLLQQMGQPANYGNILSGAGNLQALLNKNGFSGGSGGDTNGIMGILSSIFGGGSAPWQAGLGGMNR